MRKKSSDESLDFVKLIDRWLSVFDQKIGLGNAAKWSPGGGSVTGYACVDAECVNVALHQVCQRVVDEAMALNSGLTGKCCSDYKDPKMSFAVARARMAGMQMAVIFN